MHFIPRYSRSHPNIKRIISKQGKNVIMSSGYDAIINVYSVSQNVLSHSHFIARKSMSFPCISPQGGMPCFSPWDSTTGPFAAGFLSASAPWAPTPFLFFALCTHIVTSSIKNWQNWKINQFGWFYFKTKWRYGIFYISVDGCETE